MGIVNTTHAAAVLAAIEAGVEYSSIAYGPIARHMAAPYGDGWALELARLRQVFHNRPR